MGAHIEGPFITVNGAHPIENLRPIVGEKQLDQVYVSQNWREQNQKRRTTRICTIAPDLPGFKNINI